MVTPSTRLMLIEPHLLRVYDGDCTRHFEPEVGLVTAEGVIEVMQMEFHSDWFNERYLAGRRFPLVVPLEE